MYLRNVEDFYVVVVNVSGRDRHIRPGIKLTTCAYIQCEFVWLHCKQTHQMLLCCIFDKSTST